VIIKFDKPTKAATGALNNTGSCWQFVNYMRKEESESKRNGKDLQPWFSYTSDSIPHSQVAEEIDKDHQGLSKKEGKFSTGSINISESEWKAMGKTEQERLANFKQWTQKEFTELFAGNYHKKDKNGNPIEIAPEDVRLFFKLEYDRHYKGTDKEVIAGEKKSGDARPGFNIHIHFIVARKTRNGIRISPNAHPSVFNRNELRTKCENSFDEMFQYRRPKEETLTYRQAHKQDKYETIVSSADTAIKDTSSILTSFADAFASGAGAIAKDEYEPAKKSKKKKKKPRPEL
jgi:hypothetical protein